MLAARQAGIDDLELDVILQRASQLQADIAATGNHHAAHRRQRLVEQAQHRADILHGNQDEDLVAGQDAGVCAGRHKAVRLIGKTPVDGCHVGARLGQQHLQLAWRVAVHRGLVVHADRDQRGQSLGKFAHLQRFRILHQLPDVLRDRGLRANHLVDGETVLVQQVAEGVPAGGAQAGNAVGRVEALVGHLAGGQVQRIHRGTGQQHIGIGCPGFGQNRRFHAVADNAAQVKALLQA